MPRQSTETASQPNVYEVINNDEVRKVVTLHIKDMLCFFKHDKKTISRIDIGDLYTNNGGID